MKKFLIVVSILIFVLIIVGVTSPETDNKILTNSLPIGLSIFAFVWMPVFLFYAYDRKQQRQEQEEEND